MTILIANQKCYLYIRVNDGKTADTVRLNLRYVGVNAVVDDKNDNWEDIAFDDAIEVELVYR